MRIPKPPDIDGATSAFDLLREQLESTQGEFNEFSAEAARNGNYQQVREIIDKAEALGKFSEKVTSLMNEFGRVFGQDLGSGTTSQISGTEKSSPIGVSLVLSNNQFHARAIYANPGVVVLRGSTIALNEYDSLSDKWRELRRTLRNRNELNLDKTGAALILNRDLEFRSPSGAACFVVGYSVNGKLSWIVEGSSEHLGGWLNTQRTIAANQ